MGAGYGDISFFGFFLPARDSIALRLYNVVILSDAKNPIRSRDEILRCAQDDNFSRHLHLCEPTTAA
jgi:hypothetical protein